MSDHYPNSNSSLGFLDAIKSYLMKGPELEFFVGLLKKSVIFLGILLIAAGLHTTVDWVHHNNYPPYIVWGLWILENLLFVGDMVWFACNVIVSTVRETLSIFTDSGILPRRQKS
jgi:hypothetical protein